MRIRPDARWISYAAIIVMLVYLPVAGILKLLGWWVW